jgi:xylan 1,4-beta-xylosidase
LKTKKSSTVGQNNRDLFFDDFKTSKLNNQWMFLRTPNQNWYTLDEKKGAVVIKTRAETVSGNGNPSFIGFRQQHLIGEVSTEMEFSTQKENEKSGLVVFQNESHFYYLCQSSKNNQAVIQLFQSEGTAVKEINTIALKSSGKVFFKIKADREVYSFQYSLDNKKWITVADKIDAKFLSTEVAGGFVGSFYALYTTSLGQESSNQATFNWFKNTNEK